MLPSNLMPTFDPNDALTVKHPFTPDETDPPRLTDHEFTCELIRRLNRLVWPGPHQSDEQATAVREFLGNLIEHRLATNQTLLDHPTIQCLTVPHGPQGEEKMHITLGFLGVLSGLTGVVPTGPRAGWSRLCALYSDEEPHCLVGFGLTSQSIANRPDPIQEGSPTGLTPPRRV